MNPNTYPYMEDFLTRLDDLIFFEEAIKASKSVADNAANSASFSISNELRLLQHRKTCMWDAMDGTNDK